MLHAVIEIFLWLLGLSVGSFLNVVAYRLPLGLALDDPPRSFCPHCRTRIAWYDNLPLASWWRLGGRCRHCGGTISVQYPLVEGLTGLAFVLVYHLLFVSPARADLGPTLLPGDAPLLLAWLVLAAGLVACSAMDIASYMVDVRVTNLVVGAGVVLHALWPRAEYLVPRAESPVAAAAVGAFLVGAAIVWWAARREADDEPVPEPAAGPESAPASATPPMAALPGRLVIVAFIALSAALIWVGTAAPGRPWPTVAVGAAIVAAFAATVIAGGQRRPADEEIHAAIEDEQPHARRLIARELIWLSPAILAAGAVLLGLTLWPAIGTMWRQAVGWSPIGGLTPLAGVACAMHGAMVGAAAGWLLRVVFTLAFGREAFGTGDIYILAAAGAAAGWDIVLLGLALSIGVALVGWALGLLLKATALIPFGPWLALGFVLALWGNRPAHRLADVYHGNLAFAWRERPDLLLIAGGLLLVGTAMAIALARLLHRWFAPRPSGEPAPLGAVGPTSYPAGHGPALEVVKEDRMPENPIAVFDSGLGGLSVVRHLRQLLPHENLVYFGDTARIPYGTKSRPTVVQFALETAGFLLQFEPKLIVAACNTASALALDVLEREMPVPVIGVVEPGARAAVRLANGGPVAVIGTEATIGSSSYRRAIAALAPELPVVSQACPLFVPLVEEGRDCDDPIVQLAVETYLAPLRAQGVRVIVLACTHYPLLRPAIAACVGPDVHIVDSGRETSLAVQQHLAARGSLYESSQPGTMRCYVSDNAARFRAVGSRFLNEPIEHVEWVEPERYVGRAPLVARPG